MPEVRKRIILILLAAGVTAVVVGAIAGFGSSSSRSSGKLQVVAAENFWGSLAAQLGGGRVEVRSIVTDPNTDPHSYEPTAADGRLIAGAKLVIVNGIGYDAWASHLVAANGSKPVVLDVGKLVHVPAGGNAHQWFSPASVARVVAEIAGAYKRLDPGHASFYEQRRRDVEGRGLAEYRRLIASIKLRYSGTPIGISESIFEPMARALGLRLLTPAGFYDAVAEGADPSAQDKAAVDRQADSGQIKVWVYNSQNATPDVRRVTSKAKVNEIPVVTVTESLTPAGASFQAWQVAELRALEAALRYATGR
jgi:zinc/manganese transport system substrate-binding protein